MCDPATGLPVKGANLRKQLKLIQINALLVGDNIIIPASAGVKQIFEMVMWNVAAQTIIWQQGLTSGGTPIVQTKFTGFPALTGFVLGFNGSFEMPHWEIDNLQPLVLNLSVGTEVDRVYPLPRGERDHLRNPMPGFRQQLRDRHRPQLARVRRDEYLGSEFRRHRPADE